MKRFTYSDPYLSLWQSAVAEVEHRRISSTSKTMKAADDLRAEQADPSARGSALMSAADVIGATLLEEKPSAQEPLAQMQGIQSALASPLRDAEQCSKLAGEFLWAEIKRDHARAEQLAAELHASTCDPKWAECVATFLEFKASGGDFPYRANLNPVFALPGDSVKLAIFGDWGTGQNAAINLLQEIKKLAPDVLIHLGDVYYSGTLTEQQNNFLDICRGIFGTSVPIYSLCGNHDMYSGGNGYYWLVDQLGQQASYFCLQNSNWQFLAMDTGHSDTNPFTVTTNMAALNSSELLWHLNFMQQSGNRKTVVLSHHQLFSPFGCVGTISGQAYAYNPYLLEGLQSVLAQLEWWFWGHEHSLAIYDPYMDLKRGRCIGCSAVPVFTAEQSYAAASGLRTYNNGALPTWNTKAVLGNNGSVYNHGFAVMTLKGASATVVYYQVPILQAASVLYSEAT